MKSALPNFSSLLKELQSKKSEFSVSIYMPTAQMMPDKLQDRIRLKDLVAKAYKQLQAQYPERDFKEVFDGISELIDNFQFDIASKSLALFANPTFGTIVRLPFTTKAEFFIEEQFNTIPLLREYSRVNHYWILELTKKMCRLYEAYDNDLQEVVTPEFDAQGNPVQGFPLDYVEPDDKIETAVGQGDRDARYIMEHEKRYFIMVDTELGKILHEKPLPVVVCGVEKNNSLFKEITKHGAAIIGYQQGDYRNQADLAQAVAPLLHKYQQETIKKLLNNFVESAGTAQQAFGIQRVWLMAREGRIQHLLVEEGLVIPGAVDFTNLNHLILQEKLMPEQAIGNVVDVVIGQVMATGGKVVFVPKDALKDFEHIGAILRY